MIIRPLTVFEREKVRNFYLSLSLDDRRRRFCCTLADDTISKYVDRLDFTNDVVLGAFDDQGQLVGLAELVRGSRESEMAFSVRPDRRGQKIGTSLIERLMVHAAMRGVKRVFVMFLSGNMPMRNMAIRAGMPVETVDGESHAARDLAEPSEEERARWAMEESLLHAKYAVTAAVAQRDAATGAAPVLPRPSARIAARTA